MFNSMKSAFTTVVFKKFAQFDGRASRAEYWWFVLTEILVLIGLAIIDGLVFPRMGINPLSTLASLGLFIPALAAAIRRLHDTDRSGWWLLLSFIPVFGWIVFLVFLAQKGSDGDNRFGAPQPLMIEG